jgi:hypothetical protein
MSQTEVPYAINCEGRYLVANPTRHEEDGPPWKVEAALGACALAPRDRAGMLAWPLRAVKSRSGEMAHRPGPFFAAIGV